MTSGTFTGPIVVIGASEGGLKPLRDIVAELPYPSKAAYFIVSHIGPHKSHLPYLLSRSSKIPVVFAKQDMPIQHDTVYVAPSDHHMYIEDSKILLTHGPKVHYTRPAADPLFLSAAFHHKDRVIGIVLSGGDGDGSLGLQAIKEAAGVTIVQRPEDAVKPDMPDSAIAKDTPLSLSIPEINALLGLLLI